MTQKKVEFVETILNWFNTPSVGRNFDVTFLENAYDEISEPRWISVKDELPKEDVFVQVVCDDYVNIARRHENRWQLGFDTKTANHLIYTPYNNNITHWMPLPAPPNESNESDKEVTKK